MISKQKYFPFLLAFLGSMGFLEFSDKPLDYKEIEPYVDYVKTHGILQFLNNYKRLLKRPDDILKWGEEVSAFIIKR